MIDDPGLTPKSPESTDGPVLVTDWPPSTENDVAVPSPTAVATAGDTLPWAWGAVLNGLGVGVGVGATTVGGSTVGTGSVGSAPGGASVAWSGSAPGGASVAWSGSGPGGASVAWSGSAPSGAAPSPSEPPSSELSVWSVSDEALSEPLTSPSPAVAGIPMSALHATRMRTTSTEWKAVRTGRMRRILGLVKPALRGGERWTALLGLPRFGIVR